MRIVYFSPHLDDAIFSCGGIISQQVNRGGQVEVWTFFTADPPLDKLTAFARILHRRWGQTGSPYGLRRGEDETACNLLGVSHQHFGHLDCIYRYYDSGNSPLVRKTADLFKPVCEPETKVEEQLWGEFQMNLHPDDQVILPLGAGGHIDHLLIRHLGTRLPNEKNYYPDFPYSGKLKSISELELPANAVATRFDLSDDDIDRWQRAAGIYNSQISSFWKSREKLFSAIRIYAHSPVGSTLWSLPGSTR